MCEVVSPEPSTQTGLLLQILGALGTDEDGGRTAVTANAAVQLGERVGDHRATEHVVDRDRVPVVGVGVVGRVEPGGHGDFGQLFDGGAVRVHVPARGHGVLGDQGVAVGRLPLQRPARAPVDAGPAQPLSQIRRVP